MADQARALEYAPRPGGPEDTYAYGELQELAAAIAGQSVVLLKELNAEPAKPAAGMIVLADGTNWNPGSGAGFYGYYGGAWTKLG